MNPITIILAFLTAGFLFFGSLSFFTVYAKKKKEYLLRKLYREGAANDLIFCSQDILQNKVMGIDGIHRKIMILEKTKNTYQCSTISLNEVHNCHLVTHPSSLTKNQNNQSGSGPRATTLELLFEFNNHSQPASIIFSNGLIASTSEFDFLKAKAAYWCSMFSKMLNSQLELRA